VIAVAGTDGTGGTDGTNWTDGTGKFETENIDMVVVA
jgi:hypothetical protein